MAALAVIEDGALHLRAELYAPDGSDIVTGEARGAVGDTGFAARLAADLLERAPPPIRHLFAA
jgi:hydroxymethylbilane synthase